AAMPPRGAGDSPAGSSLRPLFWPRLAGQANRLPHLGRAGVSASALLAMLAFASAALGAEQAIPKHPKDLKFAPREFAPPRAADYRHKLAAGSTAFLVEDHEFPLVNISIIVRTGDYLEPEGKEGLAQITGSQMRSGGTKSRPPEVFDEEAAFLAASIGSGISDVSGAASLNCLTKNVDSGMALLIDMLRNPGFDARRLKLAKSQILQSMERRNASTQSIEAREFNRLMRGTKHFTTAEITKASLEAISQEDMIAFHDRYYYPSNFVIAVSGDFKTKDMLAMLDKAFADWPNRTEAIPAVPKPNFTPKPGVYVVDKKDVNQGRVRMGHLGVQISNPDHLALSVMNGMLGGNAFASRIVERVRSDEGLAYSSGSSFTAGTYYEGTFVAGFQSKSPSVAQATAIVLEEIERIRSSPVSAEELANAKNYAMEGMPQRFSTAAHKASQFANDYYTKLPEDYWQKYRQRISTVTVQDIQRVARTYLHPDKLVILAVGDVDTMLRGNPDRPQYSIAKIAGNSAPMRIPLPDPLTMVYPSQ
ncbi:MAG: pitrilysin family protein, partial [Bryobacteraceae bacterium]